MGCMSPSGSESQSKGSTMSKGQKKVLQQGLDAYSPSFGTGYTPYQGERLAPLTGAQQEAIGSAGGFLKSFAPNQAMSPLYGQTGYTLSQGMAGNLGAQPLSQEDTANYYKNVIQNPALSNFQEYGRPAIEGAYSGAGNFWSGDRARAVTKGGQDLFSNLDIQRAQLGWDVLGRNQQLAEQQAARQLQAGQQAMNWEQLPTQLEQSRLQGTQAAYGLASEAQKQQQMEYETAMGKWKEGQMLTDPDKLSIIMSLLGLNGGMQSSSSGSWGSGLGFNALNAMGTTVGTGLGAGLFASDISVKENIKEIDMALDKVNRLQGYTFNYTGSNNLTGGIMAQDIEKIMPEAVKEIDGIKHVDYMAVIGLLVSAIKELSGKVQYKETA